MNIDDLTRALIEKAARRLRDDFPEWRIRRGVSGRWHAARGDTHLSADNPQQLRAKLQRHGEEEPHHD
ncbi:MAG: hypothetical protein GEV03_24675 [Streptosporangiales bacterium]|nr:hypothetical protein [Streptosporangiales bacterium]